MSKTLEAFLTASESKTFDIGRRETIKYNINQYNKKAVEGTCKKPPGGNKTKIN